MQNERLPNSRNGHFHNAQRVEISDTIVIGRAVCATTTVPTDEQEFEVVGIVEDPSSSLRYAVCYCESADEFIVTDDAGALVSNEALAQEILEDFLDQSHGTSEEEDS